MTIDETMLRSLLGSLASEPDDSDASTALAEYLYPILFAYFNGRRVNRTVGVLAATGTDALVYIPPGDRSQVAHDSTVLTLRRVHARAGRYDSNRGSAGAWVFRAAMFAFNDVVSDTYQQRRRTRGEIVDGDEIDDLLRRHSPSSDVGDSVVLQVALATAVDRLPEDEGTALLMYERYGFTYKEISSFIYGEETQARSVERLLTNARARMKRILADAGLDPKRNH